MTAPPWRNTFQSAKTISTKASKSRPSRLKKTLQIYDYLKRFTFENTNLPSTPESNAANSRFNARRFECSQVWFKVKRGLMFKARRFECSHVWIKSSARLHVYSASVRMFTSMNKKFSEASCWKRWLECSQVWLKVKRGFMFNYTSSVRMCRSLNKKFNEVLFFKLVGLNVTKSPLPSRQLICCCIWRLFHLPTPRRVGFVTT